jgi:hypothetical protein
MFTISTFSRLGRKRFRPGVYYRLDEQFLREGDFSVELIGNSYLRGFTLVLNGHSLSEFIAGTGKPELLNPTGYDADVVSEKLKSKDLFTGSENYDELIVKKVGQGSWNELLKESQPKLVFDIGTKWVTSKTDVKALVAPREIVYQNAYPMLILSHWDVDHYHLLLACDDDTLKSFPVFIFRAELPNVTSQDFYLRFSRLNNAAMLGIRPRPAVRKQNNSVLEEISSSSSRLKLYNGTDSRLRNPSGMTITYQTAKIVVVFGADLHYRQLQNYILVLFNFPHDHYLIVPHHGGEAGTFTYNLLAAVKKDAIISADNVRHPFPRYVAALEHIKFTTYKLWIRQEYVLPLY